MLTYTLTEINYKGISNKKNRNLSKIVISQYFSNVVWFGLVYFFIQMPQIDSQDKTEILYPQLYP